MAGSGVPTLNELVSLIGCPPTSSRGAGAGQRAFSRLPPRGWHGVKP
jgi:hypothetical protein